MTQRQNNPQRIADSASLDDRIAVERVRTLYRNAPIGVVVSSLMGCAAAVALGYDDPAVRPLSWLWAGLLLTCMSLHLGLCWRFVRTTHPEPRRWTNYFIAIAGLEGLTWGAAVVMFTDATHYDRQLLMLVLSSGLVACTAFVFSTNLAPFRAFFYPAILPHVVMLILYTHPLSTLALLMTLMFIFSITIETERANSQVADVLRLRFENEALAADLRVQKDRAEAANIAKSRFLAAASHDLRQPVHALGLFVGALRSRQLDQESLRLVEHIHGSVGAMDELFTSLLDISKLDAGVIAPELQPVAIGPLLARLSSDYQPEAKARNIRLIHVASSAWVLSDPFLLERILRNLLVNAVRYTTTGKVLLGVRHRGAWLDIEIWDTGPGIDSDHHHLIFQEFYQVGNPERDRSRGLGLGLAIVQRLVTLLNHRLLFKSVLARGSMFGIGVPVCAPGKALNSHSLPIEYARSACIAVVDDEPDIQQAMAHLLSQWGHQVVVGASGDMILEQLQAIGAQPDLIICDYRLRGNETGADVIDRLQTFFARPIPAMLITGDTAPDRLHEAQASGHLLLHKPVPNSRLRAAIGNLLRRNIVSS